MSGYIQAGYARRQVIHTEESDRLYRGTASGFQVVELTISPPDADRALVVTGIVVSQGSPWADCCQVELWGGEDILRRWRFPLCGAQPMEFVQGIRCAPGEDARLFAFCDGAELWLNMKCRLE